MLSTKIHKQNGNGSVMMMVGCVGIIVAWFFFTTIMDYIGANNHDRIRRNLEQLNAFEKPKPIEGPREVRGYQVNY